MKNILLLAIIASLLIIGIGGSVFAQTNAESITGYYVNVNGQAAGPFDTAGLKQLISKGQLTEATLVWKEGMANWAAAATVAELKPLFSSAASRSSSAKTQDAGFAVGAELGVTNLQAEEIGYNFYIMPELNYKGFFMGDALEFDANLGVPFSLSPEFRLGLDFDIELTYDIGPLSLIGKNMLAIPMIKNDWSLYSPMFGTWYNETRDNFIPKVKYSFFFNAGTLFLQANLPIRIVPDAFEYIGMHFSLGWKGENGLSLQVWECNYPKPYAEFFQDIELIASYESALFYGEVDIDIPTYEDGIEYSGIEVNLEFEFKFANGFKAYASLPIRNLGSLHYDINYGLSVGLKKSL